MSRRSSLKYIAGLGLCASAPTVFYGPKPASAVGSPFIVSKTLPLMNTLVTMKVCDPSRQLAEEALEKAFQRLQDLIPVFNRFDPESPVSQLNQNAQLQDVPPQLFQVLQTSKYLYLQSKKSFDVSILPLLEAHQQSVLQTGKPPEIQQIKKTLECVGFEKIKLEPRSICFTRPGMRITLDGIAKGYLVDQAATSLKRQGIHSALINAGGDIRAIGNKGAFPWTIGLEDPLGRKKQLLTFKLSDLAVATSGNYHNYYDPLARHHHIISKGLGDSPQRIISATTLAPSAVLADGLSTLLFLQAPEQSLKLIESLPDAEALIITQGGRLFRSSGWQRHLG